MLGMVLVGALDHPTTEGRIGKDQRTDDSPTMGKERGASNSRDGERGHLSLSSVSPRSAQLDLIHSSGRYWAALKAQPTNGCPMRTPRLWGTLILGLAGRYCEKADRDSRIAVGSGKMYRKEML